MGHRAILREDEWLVEDGIPVTSPFRTIFDLAAVASRRELERAWHEAEVRQLTDRVSLPMLPRPRMNAPLALRGRFIEVDALWERQRFAVELDSRGVHGTKKRFETDRQRDRILVAEGWRTMRVTWRQLREEPDEIAADLKSALEQPAPTHTSLS